MRITQLVATIRLNISLGIVCEDASPPCAPTSRLQEKDPKISSNKRKDRGDDIESAIPVRGDQVSRNVKPRLGQARNDPCSVVVKNSPSATQSCAFDAPVVIVRKLPLTDTAESSADRCQAYSHGLQGHFNKLSIGVQWEIARLKSKNKITFDDMDFYIFNSLQGSNAQKGPEVARSFLDVEVDDDPMLFADAVKLEREARVRDTGTFILRM